MVPSPARGTSDFSVLLTFSHNPIAIRKNIFSETKICRVSGACYRTPRGIFKDEERKIDQFCDSISYQTSVQVVYRRLGQAAYLFQVC